MWAQQLFEINGYLDLFLFLQFSTGDSGGWIQTLDPRIMG